MAIAPTTGTGDRSSAGRVLGAAAAVAAVLARLLEFAGFWTAVLLPVAAVGVLLVRPQGWVAVAAGLFVLHGLAVVVGHCHGLEC